MSSLPPPLPSPSSPSPTAQKLSRRDILKAAGLGGVLLGGGTLLYRSVWEMAPPGEGRWCFSQNEFEVCEKLAEALFPGAPQSPFSAAEVQLAEFADRYVAGLYENERRLFKLLLGAFNVQPLLTHARTFKRLSLARRQEVLEDWAKSQLSVRKAGYQSLRFVLSMGYFEDVRVRAALGIRFGCPLPERAHLPEKGEGRRWG